jgi:hypothetical protein
VMRPETTLVPAATTLRDMISSDIESRLAAFRATMPPNA